jgi:hypothetical protein
MLFYHIRSVIICESVKLVKAVVVDDVSVVEGELIAVSGILLDEVNRLDSCSCLCGTGVVNGLSSSVSVLKGVSISPFFYRF